MTEPRSVQSYIDQTPSWPDGTPTPSVPMTRMQWRIWVLATAGKFFEGLVVFMTGVALPLIVGDFGLGPAEKGIVSAAPLAGIMLGAITLGGLADTYGRRFMFVVEMLVFAIFLVGLAWSPSFYWLVVFLFGVGLALGCDYPTAHLVISESIPSRDRGKLVLSAFAFQAIGALVGTAVGYVILANLPELGAWRWMYATAIVPAILVVVGRLYISDSGHWLMSQGRRAEAEHEVAAAARTRAAVPQAGPAGRSPRRRPCAGRQPARARLARSLHPADPARHDPGVGAVVPAGPQHLRHRHLHADDPGRHDRPRDQRGAQCLRPDRPRPRGGQGRGAGRQLADRRHRRGGAAHRPAGTHPAADRGLHRLRGRAGAGRLSLHAVEPMRTVLLFGGFMLFNFMTNVGPNAQTYLLAGEVFPTRIRGKGAGFAAAFAKIGAVLTAFLFPVVLAQTGIDFLLIGLIVTSLLGALVTWRFRIETTRVSLEDIGR